MKATAQRRKAANKGDLPRNHQVIPPALLATNFQRVQSYPSKPLLSWPAKLALLIGSMVAFALSFSFRMDWFTVVAFLIALVIHEAGHLLGMRLFRYKNLQVLFLPFLGAAAIGQNDDVPTHRRVIVYLLGPLPGIVVHLVLIASLFCGLKHIADLLFELSVVFLALKLINLLPIMPLDGGHVVNDLAFAKMPKVEPLFRSSGHLPCLPRESGSAIPSSWWSHRFSYSELARRSRRAEWQPSFGRSPHQNPRILINS